MASVIGVLVVHGIGVQEKDFADDFISEMNDRLMGLQVAPDAVVWQPAYWADLLNDRELKLWNDLSRDHDLDWVTVDSSLSTFLPTLSRISANWSRPMICIGKSTTGYTEI